MTIFRSLGSVAIVLLVIGCSDDTGQEQDREPDAAPDAAAPDAAPLQPTISMVFEPATITAGEASTLTATFTNFALIDPQSGPPVRPNEGHYHIYINENPNYVALWEGVTEFETTPQDPLGTYTMRAILVGSDHVELDPAVEAEVTLTIIAP